MSHDVYLRSDTGAVFDSNYTSNVSGMWAEALGYPLAALHDRPAVEAIPDLRRAAWNMVDNPEKYEAMNPRNGWGDYEGARSYLVDLLGACLDHPNTTIVVSR